MEAGGKTYRQKNGTCMYGYLENKGVCEECPPGRHGSSCLSECPKGYYGRLCRLECGSCKPCDPALGCVSSRIGTKKLNEVTFSVRGEDEWRIVGLTSFTLLVTFLLAFSCFILRRKFKHHGGYKLTNAYGIHTISPYSVVHENTERRHSYDHIMFKQSPAGIENPAIESADGYSSVFVDQEKGRSDSKRSDCFTVLLLQSTTEIHPGVETNRCLDELRGSRL